MDASLQTVLLPSPRVALRHGWPRLVESALLPAIVFQSACAIWGLHAAMIAALALLLVVIAWRTVTRRGVSRVLALTAGGAGARMGIALALHNPQLYFIPGLVTTLLGGIVLVTAGRVRHPALLRLAGEVVPLPNNPKITLLVAEAGVGIGMMQLLNGGASATALLTLAPRSFVLMSALITLVCGLGAAAIVLLRLYNTAAREGFRLCWHQEPPLPSFD